jgi:redox-sensitive bicupin YhaK (pirin superfamily)/predicted CoA-binding protein
MSTAIDRIIEARTRDLGGFAVGRVLPTVGRRFVGPFVFFDHMLPADAGELAVRPHPHIHLGTVTYLFEGEILHRDSLGSKQLITPGAINWMSAGRGIVHSERSPEGGAAMRHHGIQLWVGLPRAQEDSDPTFKHYPAETLPIVGDKSAQMRVLIGNAFDATSPVQTFWPMFYVDVSLAHGARVELPRGYAERAVYVVAGALLADGQRIEPRKMALFAKDATPVLEADGETRLLMLGGEPLDGPRYIWWNFVSSKPDRIIEAAHQWRDDKFPKIADDNREFIPAPDDDPHFALSYHLPSDDALRGMLLDAKTIAMVGASNNPQKPSHRIMKQLLKAGYRVIPVNPNESEVLGQPAVKSLADIQEPVDIVDVFRRSEDTPPLVDDAVKLGAKTLWLQLGVANEETASRALKAGLGIVMDTCIGATHARLQIPPKS